ncbi:hypothetical protein CVV38_04595 [Candidatus Peregrinibacteria bacterium HGW-Peregrinibacteria-1]|jgi:5'-nucleotidase|nr:MAG: hypothetical protein CVV38_04595 [Candidatus Peregrinibacteria bacterium HGW-Peregrinibacteria-1]
MENFDELGGSLKEVFSDGVDKVHVLADFDGTLTREYVDGQKVSSIIAVLRDQPGFLPEEYRKEAYELYEKYAGLERDHSLSLVERKAKMAEWWELHKRLLIRFGLKREYLEGVAKTDSIVFREGVEDFLRVMSEIGVPVVVFSASGLGEVIPMYCENGGVNFSNMYYVVNRFVWDAEGRAVDFCRPVIHTLNKDETVLSDFEEVESVVEGRRRVLLLGNNIGDLGMVKGFETDALVSIGFVDEVEDSKYGELSGAFDHVEVSYQKINKIIKELL